MRSVGWREVGVADSLAFEAQSNHSDLDTTYNKVFEIYFYRKLGKGGQVGGLTAGRFFPGFFNENGLATYDRPRRTR